MPKKPKINEFSLAKIRVVGIGGGGSNAISRMSEVFPRGIDLIAMNTDVQDLMNANARKKIQIGKNITKGLGTGMNPDLGRQAAEESRAEIADALQGADLVFITAGFGGGSGTGASSVVAEIAKEMGILTVAVITKPFSFEGMKRSQIAEEGIMKIKDRVDTLITIPNDRIFSLINKDTSLMKAFEEIDEILKNSVLGITEIITTPGIINIDFADVKAIIQDGGPAIIGTGIATGPERSIKAANMALNSPLLEISIDGAKGVLFSISGHRDLKMNEVNEVAKLVAENVDPSAKIIFGTYYDRKLKKGQIKVTLVATGFNGSLSKSTVLFPGLFSVSPARQAIEARKNDGGSDIQNFHEKIDTVPEFKKDEVSNLKEISLFNKKTADLPAQASKKAKEDEVWDIPAFLRKKKKKK
ncbi:cell division protein FtsZ [Candidatus Wolfebacteria bacterium]|nr:cell division protein FtsZ [Candidatus Wolfebacteria bacterium]